MINKALSQPKENNRYQNIDLDSFEFEEEKNSEPKVIKKTRFDYLYENSKVIEEKKKISALKLLNETKKKMNPMITSKAKKIQRDSNLFHQRLYPKRNNKISLEKEEDSIEQKDLYSRNRQQNEQLKKLYSTSTKEETDINTVDHNYTFRPEINKKSINIASKLPIDSKARLTKQPSKIQIEIENKEEKDEKKKAKTIKINKRSLSLYQQGVELMKKRQELYIKRQNEIKSMNNVSPVKSKTRSPTPRIRNEDVYIRNAKWKDTINAKNQKTKQTYTLKEKQQLTFRPYINKTKMEDDYRMIKSNLSQYLSYVTKKRMQIKQRENNTNKYYTQNKNGKKVIRTFIKEENTDMTKSPRKAKTRNTSNNNTIDVSRERSRLGLDDFFSQATEDNNHIDNYFSTYINNRSFYDMSFNINHEHSFAFANAINKVLNE